MSGSITTTATFQPLSGTSWTANDIQVSSPVVTETDTGPVEAFLGGPYPFAFSTSYFAPLHKATLSWGGGHAGTSTAGSGFTLNLSYQVSVQGGANAITALNQMALLDSMTGSANLSATETVTNSSGHVVATSVWTPSAGAAPISLAMGYQSLSVSITVQASVAAGQTGSVTFSSLQQTFVETPTTTLGAIGDNVFLDTTGTGIQTGVNAGPGVAGVTVDLLNANNGSIVATTTTSANGTYDFTNVVAGTYQIQFVTPNGYHLSPQTATAGDLGSAPDQSTGITSAFTLAAGQTITTIDAGLVPEDKLAVDKQISLDGSHWVDVGSSLADPSVIAGKTVYERVLVTNTGSLAFSSVSVADNNGVSGFTFGGASSTTLGIGGTITSDVATLVAASGYQPDTATATGIVTIGTTIGPDQRRRYRQLHRCDAVGHDRQADLHRRQHLAGYRQRRAERPVGGGRQRGL